MGFDKRSVESIEHLKIYLELSLVILERTHERIVKDFTNYVNEQKLISVFLIKDLMEFDKCSVESVEHLKIYLELSLVILERTHERIVEGFTEFANKQRLISTFLINDLMEFNKWSVESVEHLEIYLELSLVILERSHERIVETFTEFAN